MSKRSKIARLFAVAFLMLTLVVSFAGCGQPDGQDKVNLLLTGWTNTPTDGSDPYKAYIKEHYELDVVLNATSDFDNACVIGFNSNDKPDVISFQDYTTFLKFFNQGVLIDDWTPYLSDMPNFSKIVNMESQKTSKAVFTKNSKLSTLWTPADPPQWSLKIRNDWLIEFRTETSKTADWAPKVPDDLLAFARWVKTAKNPDQSSLDVVAFTSAGGSESLGTLGTWLPLMYGAVSVPPWGFYAEDDEAKFSTTDGSYERMLEFLRTIEKEQLIEPSWFSQQFSDKDRSYKGKIAIEWLPGSVTTYTQSEFTDKNGNITKDTLDWWETYPLPVDPDADNSRAGFMPGASLAGKMITVSKKAALNQEKMKKICKLIDECFAYYDSEADAYMRGEAYDALRWGIGVEKDIEYQPIENTNLEYINTSSVTAGVATYYRERQTGAWDWGAWFSLSNDGIIQGSTKNVNALVIKVAEHNIKTANMPSKPEIGAYLELNAADINEMTSDMVAFEHRYATNSWNETRRKEEYTKYITKWKTELKGTEILAQAKAQFKALGLLGA